MSTFPRSSQPANVRSAIVLAAIWGAALCSVPPTARAEPRPRSASESLTVRRARIVDDLSNLRFDRLGDPVLRWDSIAPVYAQVEHPQELLVLLVEFADRSFDRFAGQPDQAQKLADFYQQQLFDPTYRRPGTLSHYYRAQSLGTFHVQGRVVPPVRLSKPRAAYGAAIRPPGSDWRNDADPEGLVQEALEQLALAPPPALDGDVFDRWDPLDFDGDGVRDEADGYVDHVLVIYAGGDQSACNGLYKLDERLNANAPATAPALLEPAARECAERLWPHRSTLRQNLGQGPVIEGRTHERGGVPIHQSPPLWVADYNMQSEYADAGTFVHEFAHSLGLPDVYARNTQNSTGPWELMSETTQPMPQNLSAWSRLMLGWLRPRVFLAPELGGAPGTPGRKLQSLYLRTLDDPTEPASVAAEKQAQGLYRAALVVLPPKTIDLELTDIPSANGRAALYSGEGNGLDRSARVRVDLRGQPTPKAVELSFDAWWEIEAGWDFAYVEASADGGRTFVRRLPKDPRLMPARHGHDGPTSVPGFSGLSGDLDGDGRNESHPGCDPARPLAMGEDRVRAVANPCLMPTWIHATFDLTDLAGQNVWLRFHYVTDAAAVQRGLLLDNVRVTLDGETELFEGFEGDAGRGWRLDGFLPSRGHHELLVPQFYLLEYRDPYAGPADPRAPDYRYDAGIAAPVPRFYADPQTGEMRAVTVRPQAGVLAWYVDGAYAWAENDPVDNGQGRGFLLAVDAHPTELPLPGFEPWLRGHAETYDTRYELDTPDAQAALRTSFQKTLCFVRPERYRPADLSGVFGAHAPGEPSDRLGCGSPEAELDRWHFPGHGPLRSVGVVANELLPGAAREAVQRAVDLLDDKRRPDGTLAWRLRDRTLRTLHLLDAPFSLDAQPDAVTVWRPDPATRTLAAVSHSGVPPVSRFSDGERGRWLNPFLFFSGVDVPREGFGFELATPKADAPVGAKVKVWLVWER